MEGLSHAILDRHSSVVPPGVLIHILGDILIPVLQHLGEILVTAVHTELESHNRPLLPPPPVAGTKGSEAAGAHLKPPAGKSDPTNSVMRVSKPSKIAFVEEAMCCLCTAFIRQLSKLCVYPSFDRLWLRLLHVFGYFLGAAHSFDDSLLTLSGDANATNIRQRELISASHLAQEKLRNMFEILVRTKIFRRRPELWVVTVDMVVLFRRCPGLAEDPNETTSSSTDELAIQTEVVDEIVGTDDMGNNTDTDSRKIVVEA